MSSQAATLQPQTAPARTSFVVRAMKLAITISMLLLIFNDIFGGVIKFYSVSSSLLFLSFIPTLFAGVVLAMYFGTHLMVMRIHVKMGLFILIFILNALYALAIGRQPMAVGFALYIWLPFFIGLLITTFKLEHVFRKYVVLWWLIATLGVLLNSQIKFPWIGENYQVFGQTVQASREWWAGSVDRLAGFSRASYAAANEIALFCMVILAMRINIIKKIIVWTISFIAVYLTTTKTTLLIMVIAPILIGTINFFQIKSSTNDIPNKQTVRLASVIITCLTAIMVLLPIFSLTTRSSIGSSKTIGFFSFSSLFERMYRMWPDAWDLIFYDGNPITMMFGRGLGGIGTPQNFFEVLKQNSADNLFVYLYVTFGIASVFFIRHIILNIKKWADAGNTAFLTYFALTVSIVTLGMMVNVVENATTSLVLGMLIGKTSSLPKKPDTV